MKRSEHLLRRLLGGGALLVLLVATYGLSRSPARLSGDVVDPWGQPVPAHVSIEGLAVTSPADEDGRFTIAYAPGTFTLSVEAAGFIPTRRSFSLSEAMRVELSPLILTQEPPGRGLWHRSGGRLHAIAPAAAQLGDDGSLRILGPPDGVCLNQPLLLKGANLEELGRGLLDRWGRVEGGVHNPWPAFDGEAVSSDLIRLVPRQAGQHGLVISARSGAVEVWAIEAIDCGGRAS